MTHNHIDPLTQTLASVEEARALLKSTLEGWGDVVLVHTDKLTPKEMDHLDHLKALVTGADALLGKVTRERREMRSPVLYALQLEAERVALEEELRTAMENTTP